ncbi:MAG: dockerin type I repeat-containing protein [Muribaculaceae bacterium]|nr:dockerin type I repeat-containing protein [Muribaculaceae bacterium]
MKHLVIALALVLGTCSIQAQHAKSLSSNAQNPLANREFIKLPSHLSAIPHQQLERAPQVSPASVEPKASVYLEANYRRPAGAFYHSLFTGLGAIEAPMLLVPIYRPISYINTSKGNFTSQMWTIPYYNIDHRKYELTYETSRDFTTHYIYQEYDSVPELTIYNGNDASSWFMMGKEYIESNKRYKVYRSDIYADLSIDVMSAAVGMGNAIATSKYFSMFGREGKDPSPFVYYTLQLEDGKTGSWFGTNNQGISLIATAFEKPQNPYRLTSVDVYAYMHIFEDANPSLTVTIYRLPNGMPEYRDDASVTLDLLDLEVIATTTVELDESFNYHGNGSPEDPDSTPDDPGLVCLHIPIEEADEMGLTNEYTPEINDAILVALTGYDDTGFAFFSTLVSRDLTTDEGFGELGYLGDKDNMYAKGLNAFFRSSATGERMVMKTAPTIGIEVQYPFIDFETLDETGTCILNAKGDTYDTKLWSLTTSTEWDITLEDGSPLPSWLTVKCTDVIDNITDEFRNTVKTKITAAALPSGGKSRRANVRFHTPGATLIYHVIQKDWQGNYSKNGDVNGDGEIDVKDVTALISYILGDTPAGFIVENANVNEDPNGEVDVQDVTALISLILK